jgi:surface-anchored protein
MRSMVRRFVEHLSRVTKRSDRSVPVRTRLSVELLESRTLLTTVLTTEHVDLDIAYSKGAWELGVHDETNDIVYAPGDVLLYVGPAGQSTQPAGWQFIGAGDGNLYWKVPQIRDPELLLLGNSAEDIPVGTFDSYHPPDPRISFTGEWIKLTLVAVRGPGHVSAWQDGQAPSSWWISSFDGGRTLDPSFYIQTGGHVDYNWGFTAPGLYEVDFQASAFVGGSGLPTRSPIVTYFFGVETTGEEAGSAPARPPIPAEVVQTLSSSEVRGVAQLLGGEPLGAGDRVSSVPSSLSNASHSTPFTPASAAQTTAVDRLLVSVNSKDEGLAGRTGKQDALLDPIDDWLSHRIGKEDTLLV